MKDNKLIILGSGGHGAVVADIAIEMGCWSSIIFYDDNYISIKEVMGYPVVGSFLDSISLRNEGNDFFVAVGNPNVRLKWFYKLIERDLNIVSIRHPSAVISKRALVGAGCVVVANATINARASVGLGCIVNTGATIGHDCIIEEGVHICPGVHLAGGVTVGRLSWIGIGSSVIQGVKIGKGVSIGAGSVIIRDIPDGVTVAGNPGKIIKHGK